MGTTQSVESGVRAWDEMLPVVDPAELQRLQLQERILDGFSTHVLDQLGVKPGMRCLDVGAGAGSIVRWLAERVGARNVTAVDLNIAPLRGQVPANVSVLELDITRQAPADASYDLVHARLLLEHLPQREDVLSRLATLVRPGGVLVIEDVLINPQVCAHLVMRRAMTALAEMCRQMLGTDLLWAAQLPLLLEGVGLVDVDAAGYSAVMRRGSALAQLYRATLRMLLEAGATSDAITPQELAEADALFGDEDLVDYSSMLVAAWGRRP
jgi:trans-aconitate methyltransferase